ncbi:MAG: hypothetical protein Q4F18_00050 [Clostridia bacterium]|nr:hypothetical protein [Clostridia bacterium]
MKSIMKVLYIVIIGAIVFTGALMIAEGARTRREQASMPAADTSVLPFIIDSQEGRAL